MEYGSCTKDTISATPNSINVQGVTTDHPSKIPIDPSTFYSRPSLPSFRPSHIQTSTPHTRSTPHVPTPSTIGSTLPPPRPASTSHIPARRIDTPQAIPSPIDTPGSSTSAVIGGVKGVRGYGSGEGEGKGKRDDPSTPMPLGTAIFNKLKSRQDFQALTKHFDKFTKDFSKVTSEGKGEKMGSKKKMKGKIASVLLTKEKVFEGLRFCFPYEVNGARKNKTRWEIIAQMEGQVTIQPDTAITHVIHDSGRSASILANSLGLRSLSELPQGTVCVKWDWVAQCKLANRLLDTEQFLSFPKNTLTRNPAMLSKAPSRMTDISEQLRAGQMKGKSLSISRYVFFICQRPFTHPDFVKPSYQPFFLVDRVDSIMEETMDTEHDLPSGPGWEDVPAEERDGLDEMISGVKGGIGVIPEVSFTDAVPIFSNPQEINTHTNPDPLANVWRCGQSNDGNPLESPNERLAKKLDEMHDLYLGQTDKNPFSVRGYRRAAAAIRRTKTPITSGAQARSLLIGIGQGIADRIDEFLTGSKGREYYENTEKAKTISMFKDIYGVGKSFANELYRRGARTIEDLREKEYGLSKGQKIGVELYSDLISRIPRKECKQLYDLIRSSALDIDPMVWVEIMGSYRRGGVDSGDVDILITRDDSDGKTHKGLIKSLVNDLRKKGVITHEMSAPSDWSALETKWMGVGRVPGGKYRRIDILCIPFDQWGAALIYFTGNEIFNRSLRLYARKKGFSLNQRGLYTGVMRGPDGNKITEGEEIVVSKTEEDIFKILGIRWRHPHQRRP
ncbi:hypothetical protein TREMEDRAFT_26921 [Tremella mesenterica DSM 1558]|uniref:uncharacterized protein n=1 Tax=Tremella mesenterica (strain ATCC 24925 / CBS 8224 / DSM 1558 / NBRC 9311 / NRRL Y-6157 / RJB 2259-6 / UBC 559-6) TaxID=578456 RepID=UPI0003F492FD|nr:uncharacterized protein TREMEDRAFT_26921 [Tremella mesenterica DSM 1558]EIW71916.1 hypothetical protein TREMEDRAFT_26921 [Tremella mesenterica DSM 1558]